MKTSYFFGENNLKSFFRPGWKGMGDPGVEEGETRIYVKPKRGCGAVYLPCLRRFYALFLIINPVEYLLFKHKQFLILVDGHYESRMHK
ncbi:MAG: hypothetical protein SPG99_09265 [Parabacteroides merdae]|nr:hypothetical protein [Parabacteroides merdae]